MTLLSTSALRKEYGGLVAVSDVSLEVAAGERRGILGPNGAGKTTLFDMLGGQTRPTSGRILLDGVDITGSPPHARVGLGLARTFQISSLFLDLTVEDNLLLAHQARRPERRSMTRPISRHRELVAGAGELVERWDFTEVRRALVRELSYGEQRRLEIALALAGEPRILLLDEPTAGLSPAETRQIRAVIDGLDEVTTIFIEHDMDFALDLAERLTVLHAGRVIADGPTSEVRQDPRVHEIYLGAP